MFGQVDDSDGGCEFETQNLFRCDIHLKSAITDHDPRMISDLIQGRRVPCPDKVFLSAKSLMALMKHNKISSMSVDSAYLYNTFLNPLRIRPRYFRKEGRCMASCFVIPKLLQPPC